VTDDSYDSCSTSFWVMGLDAVQGPLQACDCQHHGLSKIVNTISLALDGEGQDDDSTTYHSYDGLSETTTHNCQDKATPDEQHSQSARAVLAAVQARMKALLKGWGHVRTLQQIICCTSGEA